MAVLNTSNTTVQLGYKVSCIMHMYEFVNCASGSVPIIGMIGVCLTF